MGHFFKNKIKMKILSLIMSRTRDINRNFCEFGRRRCIEINTEHFTLYI